MNVTSLPITASQLGQLLHQGIETGSQFINTDERILLTCGFTKPEIVALTGQITVWYEDKRKADKAAKEARIASALVVAEQSYKEAMTVSQLIEKLEQLNPDARVLLPSMCTCTEMVYVEQVDYCVGVPGNFPFDITTFDRVELA